MRIVRFTPSPTASPVRGIASDRAGSGRHVAGAGRRVAAAATPSPTSTRPLH
jgi:hypothetical protein